MASKQPPKEYVEKELPTVQREINQLTAGDENYFTTSGAKYEYQLDRFTTDLQSKLKGYAPEIKQIATLEAAHKKHINDVNKKSVEIQVGYMLSSRMAKLLGIVLGAWAVWEVYHGAKRILKKWANHEAREQGLIPRSPPKRQRIHSRDWHHNNIDNST